MWQIKKKKYFKSENLQQNVDNFKVGLKLHSRVKTFKENAAIIFPLCPIGTN